MKFKALLLDLDDTMIKSNKIYDKALRFSARFLSEKYGLDEQGFFSVVLEKHMIVKKNFPSIHTRHSRILVFRMALEECVKNYDLSLLPDVEDMYWEYFLNNIEVYDGVRETLAKAKKAGIKTAIVSDGDLSLRIRKARRADLLRYVDVLVASEEVIFEKPFSAIFTLALSKLEVGPEKAVMLGNDYKNDVRGAQLVGIYAGLFDPKEDANLVGDGADVHPDFVIKQFSDVLEVLGVAK